MRELKMRRTQEIDIRDVYILPYQGKYYMYGTEGFDAFKGTPSGYLVYVSEDLENWNGPFSLFRNDGSSWANFNYWAPEVYEVDGSFYLFSSWTKKERAVDLEEDDFHLTQQILCVLKSSSPMGPFTILNDNLGPGNDPTLYQEKDHFYLIHNDGFANMQVQELSKDLSHFISEPCILFDRTDSDVTWSKGGPTEGAFTYRTPTGRLLLFWSSFCEGKSEKFRRMGFKDMDYGTAIAYSKDGNVYGPYEQENILITEPNMGHVSLFHRFDGQLMLATHYPDDDVCELGCSYPVFFPIKYDEEKDTLRIVK